MVDAVGINYTSDAVESIKHIKPNYYFKGKDYQNKKDFTARLQKETKAIKKNGGKIIFTESPLKAQLK